ncbi:Endogenous retrovirus group 3 member 1 Env polyprotein [Plecturocebus cupreus]
MYLYLDVCQIMRTLFKTKRPRTHGNHLQASIGSVVDKPIGSCQKNGQEHGKTLGNPIYNKPTDRDKRTVDLRKGYTNRQLERYRLAFRENNYDPATWAHDGSCGYCTPIYMINHIIRLQAVLDIITNEIFKALDLLAV